MLFENPSYTEGDVVTIKMISGEEVIAKYVGNGPDNTLSITKPYILAHTQNGPALAPFVITGDKDATLHFGKGTFVCAVKTDQDMAVQYTQVTTGITIAPGANIHDINQK